MRHHIITCTGVRVLLQQRETAHVYSECLCTLTCTCTLYTVHTVLSRHNLTHHVHVMRETWRSHMIISTTNVSTDSSSAAYKTITTTAHTVYTCIPLYHTAHVQYTHTHTHTHTYTHTYLYTHTTHIHTHTHTYRNTYTHTHTHTYI